MHCWFCYFSAFLFQGSSLWWLLHSMLWYSPFQSTATFWLGVIPNLTQSLQVDSFGPPDIYRSIECAQISRVPSHKRFNNEGFRHCATWTVSLKSACADNGLWCEHHNTAPDIFALIWLLGCGSVAQWGSDGGMGTDCCQMFYLYSTDCIAYMLFR